jgi:DNA-binding response OmpR family regulator
VCRKLRELYPLSCIPIIMVSAKSKEEHIVEGLAAGSKWVARE